MKKKVLSAVFAAALALSVAVPAYAVGWYESAENVWHYDTKGHKLPEDFLKSTWSWIDSNYDGTAQCFCFDENGVMYYDTVTPDGYTVDQFGRWTVDGVVQQRSKDSGSVAVSASAEALTSPAASSWYERFEVAETADGKTWENGFMLAGDLSRAASVTYSFAGRSSTPNTVFLNFAPKAGQDTRQTGRVSVVGLTSGRTLYRCDAFGVNSAPISVSVNIHGEDAGFRVDLIRGFDVLFQDPLVQ